MKFTKKKKAFGTLPCHPKKTTMFLNSRRCAPILYAAVYFVCMILVDFTIEGTQNAFPNLKGLPYCMTLFQFGYCFLLPVTISRGQTLKNLPTTIRAAFPYVVLSLVVFSSNVCRSASARYVSFPTKVIFRSTKLIPVMIVASMLNIGNRRSYGRLDFLAALMLCAGAAGYGFGEHSLNDDKKDSWFGIVLLTLSVLCDAFTPNIKQWLMNPTTKSDSTGNDRGTKPSGSTIPSSPSSSSLITSLPDVIISDSSRSHDERSKPVIARRILRAKTRLLEKGGMGLSATALMTNTYAVGCTGLLAFMTLTGHLHDAIGEAMVRPNLFANLSLIGIFLSTAVFAHTRLIKESGAVTAVAVATLREFFTVLLSYLVYPKIFSTLHAVSALSVFGGIVLSSYTEFQSPSQSDDDDENGNRSGPGAQGPTKEIEFAPSSPDAER
mmetsp:Transcript_18343/g.42287  ORF Transcript_18343/g.42287 Transcript_18343/m.42287 type:complete len:438 (-) Transcript_18343:471-1784(-)